jgi:hypothetical protein
MSTIRLIHPIYLDVPMLVSFAAAIQGGLSFGSEITQEKGTAISTDAKISGTLGFSKLFSSLFAASLKAEARVEQADEDREIVRESRAHTEASIAITLYDHLTREGGYLFTPKTEAELADLKPGALIEIRGTIEKNAIDTVIDNIDAIDILSNLDTSQSTKKSQQKSPLRKIRDSLDADRKRTPISNVLCQCEQPAGARAVVTLRTANLRDLTLSELHRNSVHIVGKVTRTIGEGEAMSAFENYGMALLPPEMLNKTLQTMRTEEMNIEFPDVEVQGPAVQVLPLMVFV